MTLPFTHAQFLDGLGAFNTALWPVAAALWLVTLVLAIQWFRGRVQAPVVVTLLAVHWAWSGIGYHAMFFTRINPAAWLFACLFVIEAGAFIWLGLVRRRLVFETASTPRHLLAGLFVVYALAYPFLAYLAGLGWPRMPAFGVPCPTTLFTAGMLLAAARPAPRWVFVIPVLWSVIGGSAALSLGITPDLALFVAAVAMLGYAVRQHKARRTRVAGAIATSRV